MIIFAFVFGYLSLLIELIFFHVPSVANTQNFFKKNNNYEVDESEYITKIYKWPMWKKIMILAVPFFFINVYFLLPFLYFFPNLHESKWLVFETNNWLIIIGTLCVIAGRLITFGSMLYMRKENKQIQNSFKLHVSGIFNYSRNPGLDGMFLFFTGFGILFPSFLIWGGLILYFFYMRFRVKIEEEFLKKLFKEEYLDYIIRTKRFLLF
ncbi:Protein-S-isoprenylcysteine O-methyltransferase Ste14 [Flavobacterium sp. CF108]|uniref:methyltransferase family protein n=1 Tax=unclassified Flavobacterium TaxID=196869 RepID=UPI0008ADDFB7|nr:MULTISPECIES: isoprenylcysteine carboxylmethyltransferase family protein [unclassified Flavobacterium]SEP24556.1 Protein-S-isoprenylcysteine O-methyltransferase Ste14 [Flavobacterium sp. fv08]SHI01884.1 Protein-S-isoprenylcysteine O-methyltransferase Ste14 [Flavobacterium sp. CF108]